MRRPGRSLSRSVLLLFLVSCQASALSRSEPDIAEDRVLQVQDGAVVRQYAVPGLNRDGSLSLLFTEEQLREYVGHEKSRFPQSKMPQFSILLSPLEIGQVVAYLQSMQQAQ